MLSWLLYCLAIAVMLATSAMNLHARRQWRQLQRDHAHEGHAADAAAYVVAQLVARQLPWLECDGCGGSLDPHQPPGIGVMLNPEGRVAVLCSACHD